MTGNRWIYSGLLAKNHENFNYLGITGPLGKKDLRETATYSTVRQKDCFLSGRSCGSERLDLKQCFI